MRGGGSAVPNLQLQSTDIRLSPGKGTARVRVCVPGGAMAGRYDNIKFSRRLREVILHINTPKA
jgi:hypothetical protein